MTSKRHITIPVEIPPLPVLHTASLSVESRTRTNPFSIGDIIPATLHITHTRAWAEPWSDTGAKPLFFFYDLEASPDTWLIAGQRRACFSAVEGETKSFPLMLLPRRAGKLILPMLEIKQAKEEQGVEGGAAAACELDYESQDVMVEVVPGLTGVSLEMGRNINEGLDVWILEVERRNDGAARRVI